MSTSSKLKGQAALVLLLAVPLLSLLYCMFKETGPEDIQSCSEKGERDTHREKERDLQRRKGRYELGYRKTEGKEG
jgi:hypothetical protein